LRAGVVEKRLSGFPRSAAQPRYTRRLQSIDLAPYLCSFTPAIDGRERRRPLCWLTCGGYLRDHIEDVLRALADGVNATGSDFRDVTNAMTGEPLGRVPHCTRDDVATAAVRARQVQTQWAERPIAERAAVMLRLHDLVLECQNEVLHIYSAGER
jgi:Aldehyde dehydrogenase family